MPCALLPAPIPTPYSLLPTPYALRPTPYSLVADSRGLRATTSTFQASVSPARAAEVAQTFRFAVWADLKVRTTPEEGFRATSS